MSEEENKMMTEETDWTKEPEEATEEAEAEPETAESAPAGVSRKHKKKIGKKLLIGLLALLLVVVVGAAALINHYLNRIEKIDNETQTTMALEEFLSLIGYDESASIEVIEDLTDEDLSGEYALWNFTLEDGYAGPYANDPDISWAEDNPEGTTASSGGNTPRQTYAYNGSTTYDYATAPELNDQNLINIVLVGDDTRGSSRERSDVIMLVSINPSSHRIALVSFMRDMYLPVYNGYSARINMAYQAGGFPTLYQCLKNNFGLHIDGGVKIDFMGFVNTIDALGGIDINLTQAEADYINRYYYSSVPDNSSSTTKPTTAPTTSPTKTEPATKQTEEATTEAGVTSEAVESESSEETIVSSGEESTEYTSVEYPTETSPEESTEVPTEAPTVAPTEPSTEASTEAPTDTPTEAPTVASTEAPTEAPTQASTEAPTTAATEAPEETAADQSDSVKAWVPERYVSSQNGALSSGIYVASSHPTYHAGMNHLDGRAALAYCRIRKIDSDFARTERQRKVMSILFNKFKNPGAMQTALNTVLRYVATDMSNSTITSYAAQVLPSIGSYSLSAYRIPVDGTYRAVRINGQDVLQSIQSREISYLKQYLQIN